MTPDVVSKCGPFINGFYFTFPGVSYGDGAQLCCAVMHTLQCPPLSRFPLAYI